MGLEKDLPPGEQLLASSAHSWTIWPRRICHRKRFSGTSTYVGLGGKLIRELNDNSAFRKKPVDRVLANMIEYGGRFFIAPRISRDRSAPRAGSPPIPRRDGSQTLAITHRLPPRGIAKS
jgi:hypothetical protein